MLSVERCQIASVFQAWTVDQFLLAVDERSIVLIFCRVPKKSEK